MKGIQVKASLDFWYQNRAFPHIPTGSGHVEFSMQNGAFVTTDAVLSVLNGRPQVNFDNTDFGLGKFTFDISHTGADWLYDILSSLANGEITKGVKDGVKAAINAADRH